MKISRGLFIKRSIQLVLAFVAVDMLAIEKFFFETKEFFIDEASPQNRNVKLVQVSDLHLRSIGYLEKQIANRVNAAQPDLILITGDAVDKSENLDLLR